MKNPEYTEKERIAIANALIDIVGYALGWLSEFASEKMIEKELGFGRL